MQLYELDDVVKIEIEIVDVIAVFEIQQHIDDEVVHIEQILEQVDEADDDEDENDDYDEYDVLDNEIMVELDDIYVNITVGVDDDDEPDDLQDVREVTLSLLRDDYDWIMIQTDKLILMPLDETQREEYNIEQMLLYIDDEDDEVKIMVVHHIIDDDIDVNEYLFFVILQIVDMI